MYIRIRVCVCVCVCMCVCVCVDMFLVCWCVCVFFVSLHSDVFRVLAFCFFWCLDVLSFCRVDMLVVFTFELMVWCFVYADVLMCLRFGVFTFRRFLNISVSKISTCDFPWGVVVILGVKVIRDGNVIVQNSPNSWNNTNLGNGYGFLHGNFVCSVFQMHHGC